jgi:glycosyltransferase involved in cell wall biosynthesis
MAETGSSTRVAVCVLTYRRPKGLKRLLDALRRQEFHREAPRIEIIVVGNDADGSGEAVCRGEEGVRYCGAPQRGIATARNTALREALPGNDFVIFIDDDGVPEPEWLYELLSAQRTYSADVVTGPVRPHFIQPPPAWVVKGRIFETRRRCQGQRVKVAYTSNVLIRAAVFKETGLRFDQRLDLVGGEDRHMFQRIFEAGYRIVWSDRAVVREWIPANRTTWRWVLRRSFRAGNSMTFTQLDLRPGFSTAAKLFSEGMARSIVGGGLLVSGLVRGQHVLVDGARHLAYATGLLTGIGGVRYREYLNTDGE